MQNVVVNTADVHPFTVTNIKEIEMSRLSSFSETQRSFSVIIVRLKQYPLYRDLMMLSCVTFGLLSLFSMTLGECMTILLLQCTSGKHTFCFWKCVFKIVVRFVLFSTLVI